MEGHGHPHRSRPGVLGVAAGGRLVRQGDGDRLAVGVGAVGAPVHRQPGRHVDGAQSVEPRDRGDEEKLLVVRLEPGAGRHVRGVIATRGGRLGGAGSIGGGPARPVELGLYPNHRVTDPEIPAVAEQGADLVAHRVLHRVHAVRLGRQGLGGRHHTVRAHRRADLPRRTQRHAAPQIPGQPQPWPVDIPDRTPIRPGKSPVGACRCVTVVGGSLRRHLRTLGRVGRSRRAGLARGRTGLRTRLHPMSRGTSIRRGVVPVRRRTTGPGPTPLRASAPRIGRFLGNRVQLGRRSRAIPGIGTV